LAGSMPDFPTVLKPELKPALKPILKRSYI
jgi:hypothetical protein